MHTAAVQPALPPDPTRFVYGGLAFDVHPSPALRWELGREHRVFSVPAHVGPTALTLHVSVAPAAGLDGRSPKRDILWQWEGNRFWARTKGARIEGRELGRGNFVASALVEPNANGCSSMCTALTGVLLARVGGLVLHASGVEHEGRAFLFIGPSGAGKTTNANLCQGANWFAKDRASLFPTERGWYVAGMSGGDPIDLPRSSAGVLPLAGILRVRQGIDTPRVESTEPAHALMALRESLQTTATTPTEESLSIERLMGLAAAVPVGELRGCLGRDPLPAVSAWRSEEA